MASAPSDLVKRPPRPLQSRLRPLTPTLTLILPLMLTSGRIEYRVSSIEHPCSRARKSSATRSPEGLSPFPARAALFERLASSR